ncbi:hypothetical protein RNJ44_03562 [Nakaseomyces bracarensis]|uniref:tRNA dimethylallyltransferase n=1 Tax=Nakaseomyces bracarensis TaxID=273131 RepID=A0ABR4NXB0_9SACH
MSLLKKVIVVAGTTGVGKSQLSIQLAKKYNGEVINSDSMQVYRDIPVITNKHPLEEREGIQHHVMNHVGWDEEYFLHRFEDECLTAIDDIHNRNKVPIIVGGTHYYLQVLFNKHVDASIEANIGDQQLSEKQRELLDSGDNELVHRTLSIVDPTIAKKFHPNDNRRVRRMLEIYYLTHKKPSELFEQQEVKLKFDTLFYWIYSEPHVLDQRLDARVDSMLQTGGMDEINQLFDYYNEQHMSPEKCENGVWQVIGFKEFLPWLLNPDSVTLQECIERMKIRTRQYAKRQVKWIRKMLIPDIKGDIYVLNATDLSDWQNSVSKRAFQIGDQFMEGISINYPHAPEGLKDLISKEQTVDRKLNDWQNFTCETCRDHDNKPLICIGEKNWNIHLKSKRHRANLNRGSKKAEYEKWKRSQLENPKEI